MKKIGLVVGFVLSYIFSMTVLSPVSVRLRFIRFWNSHFTLYKNFNYVFFIFLDRSLLSFFSKIFNSIMFLKGGFLFSHITLLRSSFFSHLYIFFYDSFSSFVKNRLSSCFNSNSRYSGSFGFNVCNRWRKSNISVISSLFSMGFFKNFYAFFNSISFFEFVLFEFLLRFFYFFSSNFRFFNNLFFDLSRFFFVRIPGYRNLIGYKVNFVEQEMVFRLVRRSFSFTNYGDLSLFNLERFFRNQLLFFDSSLNIRFVTLFNEGITAKVLGFLAAHKIRLFARPTSRKSKLGSSFFDHLLHRVHSDPSVFGLKLLLTGRINRRGRAMWKIFSYQRVPRNIFRIPLEYSVENIRTMNGVLTLKVFLFRHSPLGFFGLPYNNFFFIPFKEFFKKYTFGIHSFGKIKSFDFNYLDSKRRFKKLKRSLVNLTGFTIL